MYPRILRIQTFLGVFIHCPLIIKLNLVNALKTKNSYIISEPGLRIHFNFMRIRIVNPHWKKIDPDPDPGYFFKIY